MLSAVNARNAFQIPSVSNKVKSDKAFTSALSSPIASSNLNAVDTLEISATAKAQAKKLASPQFNQRYFDRLNALPNSDLAAQVAKDADALSASQGLPSGKYDFTSLTPGQAMLVVYNLKNNLGAKLDASVAIGENIPHGLDDTTKINLVQPLTDYAKYAKESSLANTEWLNDALSTIAKFSANGPRANNAGAGLTDSIIKFNEALAAFKKEASLTPAQRARRDVIKIMDLTEDAIKAMPVEQQKVTEQKIAAEIARRLRLGDAEKDQTAVASPGLTSTDTVTLTI